MALLVAVVAGLASLGVFLLAAKAHGRQLRLERELEGHLEVDFRRDNHPWVEALWRHDRVRFWPIAAVAGLLLAAVTSAAPQWGWRRPDFAGAWPVPVATLAAAVLGGMTVAFTANGVASARRLRRALASVVEGGTRYVRVRRERAAWLNGARRGTWTWWTSVAIGGLVVVLCAFAPWVAPSAWRALP